MYRNMDGQYTVNASLNHGAPFSSKLFHIHIWAMLEVLGLEVVVYTWK